MRAASRGGLSEAARAYSRYDAAGRYAERAGSADVLQDADEALPMPVAGSGMMAIPAGVPQYDDASGGQAYAVRRTGASGVIPYVIYGVVALVLATAWFVWVKATVAGSVMAEPLHFSVGVVLLVAMLVVGVIVAVMVGLLTRDRSEMGTFDALAVSMGKTAIGMAVFVVAWIVLMLLAAQ